MEKAAREVAKKVAREHATKIVLSSWWTIMMMRKWLEQEGIERFVEWCIRCEGKNLNYEEQGIATELAVKLGFIKRPKKR